MILIDISCISVLGQSESHFQRESAVLYTHSEASVSVEQWK